MSGELEILFWAVALTIMYLLGRTRGKQVGRQESADEPPRTFFGGCQHQWTEVGRTFTKGSGGSFKGVSETTMIRLLTGYTNIEMTCERCGDIKVIKETGKVGVH